MQIEGQRPVRPTLVRPTIIPTIRSQGARKDRILSMFLSEPVVTDAARAGTITAAVTTRPTNAFTRHAPYDQPHARTPVSRLQAARVWALTGGGAQRQRQVPLGIRVAGWPVCLSHQP